MAGDLFAGSAPLFGRRRSAVPGPFGSRPLGFGTAMQSLTTPVHSLPDVLFHYLVTGFGKLEAPALVSGGGMPAER